MEIDDQTLERYRRNYAVGAEITKEHVASHVALEGSLTKALLGSNSENRWATFSEAYTTLYESLPWLNRQEPNTSRGYGLWARLIRRPSKIFEVGSGKAGLLRFLLGAGHLCVATEITQERGSKHLKEADGLVWRTTDGVNLANFERTSQYDVVISTQVLEHLHPDDLGTHLKNAREILKPGGRYIFDTPHRGTGPHDLSLVLGLESAQFMHLREYNYLELTDALKQADFHKIRAIFSVPRLGIALESYAYLAYCRFFDRLEASLIHSAASRRRFRRLAGRLRVSGNIWLSATRR